MNSDTYMLLKEVSGSLDDASVAYGPLVLRSVIDENKYAVLPQSSAKISLSGFTGE